MEFIFGIKDFLYTVALIFSFAGGYFTLKIQSKYNKEKAEDTRSSLEKFKDFIYDEIKDIKEDLHKMLEKDEAERRYLPRTEHKLGMDRLEQKIDLILEVVKDK
ncbi:MAG: hypothetical protein C0625_15340 [Arcobacter sp.]|nr:MAG: hypothetical protein C0625_15340 [Arcobacter sp.]